MEINKDKRKEVAVYCFEQRLLSHIRSVKLVREIANGTQTRLAKWVF
jgi:hypothetical protein